MHTTFKTLLGLVCFALPSMGIMAASARAVVDDAPAVGDRAPDFTLKALDDSEVRLSRILEEGPAVVVVLRGYPGYQCPICSKQIGSLISAHEDFAKKKARVIFIYPGAVDDLTAKAKEFLKKTELPEGFVMVTDPKYVFTNTYGLRWDAPKETAYPSTFVIDSEGKVLMAKISQEHGGRADTKQVLASLP